MLLGRHSELKYYGIPSMACYYDTQGIESAGTIHAVNILTSGVFTVNAMLTD